MAQKIQFNHLAACLHTNSMLYIIQSVYLTMNTPSQREIRTKHSNHDLDTFNECIALFYQQTKNLNFWKKKRRILAKTHAVFIAKQKSSSLQIFCVVATTPTNTMFIIK